MRQQHRYLAPVPRVDLRGIPAQFNGLRKAVADADRVSFVVDRDQKRAAGALGDNRLQRVQFDVMYRCPVLGVAGVNRAVCVLQQLVAQRRGAQDLDSIRRRLGDKLPLQLGVKRPHDPRQLNVVDAVYPLGQFQIVGGAQRQAKPVKRVVDTICGAGFQAEIIAHIICLEVFCLVSAKRPVEPRAAIQ